MFTQDNSEPTVATVKIGCERLVASIRFIFDNEFDKVELYIMRNVLRFPDGVSDEYKRMLDESPTLLDVPLADAPPVDEDLLDAELQALVSELKRATDENEGLRFRQRSAQAHVNRMPQLLADDPDIVARAEAAVANFATWRQELEILRQQSFNLAEQLASNSDDGNPPATSPL